LVLSKSYELKKFSWAMETVIKRKVKIREMHLFNFNILSFLILINNTNLGKIDW